MTHMAGVWRRMSIDIDIDIITLCMMYVSMRREEVVNERCAVEP
jgi:hypothetical protein